MSALEEALALQRDGAEGWLAFADPRYEAGYGMLGGWTAAVMVRAAIESVAGGRTPSAITVNYLSKVEPGGQVAIRVRPLGEGRSLTHCQVEVLGFTEPYPLLAQALLVLSDRRDTDGHTEPTMPPAPDPDSLEEFRPPGPDGKQLLFRPVSGHPPFDRNDTSSVAWVRDMTGRSVDHAQLAFLADAYAPRCFFWSKGPRMSATMTLSAFFHATAAELAAVGDDYLLSEAIGTRGAQSTSGQQLRLWSRKGDLLATSEQICWYR